MLDLTQICWYNDRVTRNFIEKNGAELSDPSSMKIQLLMEAITYCKSYDNPFVAELLSRSGHTDQYNAASNDHDRHEVLLASARAFNYILI